MPNYAFRRQSGRKNDQNPLFDPTIEATAEKFEPGAEKFEPGAETIETCFASKSHIEKIT